MMRKMMMLVCAIMMVAASNAENLNVKPFKGVNVNVPARVRLVYGEKYGIDVQASDSLVASAIRWDVKDGVLSIRMIDENEAFDNVCITVMSPVEPKLTVGRNMELRETKRMQGYLTAKHNSDK